MSEEVEEVEEPCCQFPEDANELWQCPHGIWWKNWPDYEDDG